jgi:hypothetical protein
MSLGPETRRKSWRPGPAWAAAGAYVVLALVLTWPLARGLGRDFPADLADPVLNSWIVAWGADHILRFAAGEWGAFSGYWDANIFHPSPLALAYSEHLFAQSLQAAPVYAATGNAVLCYNLLFLSTFVVSGLGLFLYLRDVTGKAAAAFAGGLFFAFTPFRFEQMPHLQVMSFHWMPLVLLAVRRFVATGRPITLVLGTAALLAHNLSCGYHMLFFAPFVVAYAFFEMSAQGQIGSGRRWVGLALGGGLVAAVSLRFLVPYMELRLLEATVRSRAVVEEFSADLAGWVTATPRLVVWGPLLPGLDRPEGHLFPGAIPILLAALGIAAAVHGAVRGRLPSRPPWPRLAAAAVIVLLGVGAFDLLPGSATSLVWRGPAGLAVTPSGLGALGLACLLALAVLSARCRRLLARAPGTVTGFSAFACLFAVWLSLGPVPRAGGRELGVPGPYAWLYDLVPGFDGLRAPARYAAVAVLFLAVLAGLALARAGRLRFGALAAPLCGSLFLLESLSIPLPLNEGWGGPGVSAPPPPGHESEPAVYSKVRALAPEAVLVELPLGETVWETRAMYYSTRHWRRLVNGYSGHFPRRYVALRAALRRALPAPDAAWTAIEGSGATHVIVHERAWIRRGVPRRIARQLEERGARRLGQFDGDVLLELPPSP